jgi:uncharacterized protein YcfJ
MKGRFAMIRTSAMAAAFLALAATLPAPQAKAQETLGGAIGGAILGGAIGGAVTGRAGGAVAGALIGGATGAMIGAQAEQRRGYYWWRGRCYYRYPSGEYMLVQPDYCY